MDYNNHTTININAHGNTLSDMQFAIDEAVRLVKEALNREQGNYRGQNENETGAFDFNMTSSGQFLEES